MRICSLVMGWVVCMLFYGSTAWGADVATLPMGGITVPPMGKVYFQVRDEANKPIGGATLCICHTKPDSWIHPTDRTYTTDENGFVALDAPDYCSFQPVRVEKQGYDGSAWYLNPKMLHVLRDHKQYTRDNPFVLRLRKLNAEQEILVFCRGLKLARACDDSPVPPQEISLLGNVGGKYVDMFVQPHFDKLKSEWVLSLWTTNSNAGIISTTNRVYVAPKDGYQQRVEVSQRDLLCLSQTVYLKTRPQQLYAMLAFEFGDVTYQDGPNIINLTVNCKNGYINPYGGRILEKDERSVDCRYNWNGESIADVLARGGFPLRMDVTARLANRQKYKPIAMKATELANKGYSLMRKKEAIRIKMNGKPKEEIEKALEPVEKMHSEIIRELRVVCAERNRLEEELPRLVLPPGVTEKDKYPKKTQ